MRVESNSFYLDISWPSPKTWHFFQLFRRRIWKACCWYSYANAHTYVMHVVFPNRLLWSFYTIFSCSSVPLALIKTDFGTLIQFWRTERVSLSCLDVVKPYNFSVHYIHMSLWQEKGCLRKSSWVKQHSRVDMDWLHVKMRCGPGFFSWQFMIHLHQNFWMLEWC